MIATELSTVDLHTPIVKSLRWKNEAATELFASRLARQSHIKQAYIEIKGNLGAGKTTFIRYLLRALGVLGSIRSPTYNVVELYDLPQLQIWHFDFYRFSDASEWDDAGFRDIFSQPGLKLAEWPENVLGFAPVADLVIRIEVATDMSRNVTVQTQTPLGDSILAGITR